MNRAQRNCNPLNLRFAHQTEAMAQDKDGFAIFATPEAGWRAAHAQIELDKSRGFTMKEFIFKFAPPNENDTNNYLEFVCEAFSVWPTDRMKTVNTYALAGVMSKMEGYYDK